MYSASYWSVQCFMLKCTVLHVEVYSASCWSVQCFMLKCTVLHIEVYSASYWSVQCFILKCTVLHIEVHSASYWSVQCFILKCTVLYINNNYGSPKRFAAQVCQLVLSNSNFYCIAVLSILKWLKTLFTCALPSISSHEWGNTLLYFAGINTSDSDLANE